MAANPPPAPQPTPQPPQQIVDPNLPVPIETDYKRAGNSIIATTIAFIILVVAVVIGFLVLQSQLRSEPMSILPPTSDPELMAPTTVSVELPQVDSEIGGLVTVAGTVTGAVDQLTVQILDAEDNLLGSNSAELGSADAQGLRTYTLAVDIKTSPTTATGYILVFPTAAGDTSPLTQRQGVRFQSLEVENRLRIFAPLTNQVMSGGSVLFRGQVTGFSNSSLEARLVGENGVVITTVTFQGTDFQQTVTIPAIALAAGDSGIWELYFSDSGNEEVLLKIPVRFER